MASRYYGLALGANAYEVVEGASSDTTDIEVQVDLANSPTREDVVVGLTNIINYIMRDQWPPA
jgi:hypothetical protein